MTAQERIQIERLGEKMDLVVENIHKMDLKFTESITELRGAVHKNNNIKSLVEKNTEAIGGNAKIISEHVLLCSAKGNKKQTTKGDLKWWAVYVLTLAGLFAAIFLK